MTRFPKNGFPSENLRQNKLSQIKMAPCMKGDISMKIAISSTGPGLNDLVDPRFSRCRYYIFYDTDTGSYESKENTAGMN